MNRYVLTYYTSGGYKTTTEFATNYELRNDADGEIVVVDGKQRLGDVVFLEKLLVESLGWFEEITIVSWEHCHESA